MRDQVFINEGLLVIHEGEEYYDTRTSYEIKGLTKLVEDIGVKGGHVGWSLFYNGEEHMMGRKLRVIMEKIKDMINDGTLDIEYETRTNMKQRCF